MKIFKVALATVALALGACGKHETTAVDETDPCVSGVGVCVAFASNFAGYHAWKSYDVTNDASNDVNSQAIHNDTLTTYINKLPPHGSTEFPIGTIIVKEPSGGDPTNEHIFAGVKRGGDYDASGVVNWEWFELTAGSSESPVILWRGVGPPVGEVYGGNPAACNTCHQGASKNDFIFAAPLQLSNF